MAKNKPQKKHNDVEKKELIEKICELYGSDTVTIESCCLEVGISEGAFYEWIRENKELAVLYKEAKDKQHLVYKGKIRQLAKTALEKKLVDTEYIEKEEEGINMPNGDFVVKRTKTKTKIILADTTAIMYALNNSNDPNDPNFNHASKVENSGKIELTHNITGMQIIDDATT